MKLPNPSDLSRRDFMLAGTTMVAVASTGTVQADSESEADGFRAAAVLVGPEDARPEPGDPFFERKNTYAYVYQPNDATTKWVITDDMPGWADFTSSGIWTDSDGDGLAELPNHDGFEVGRAKVTTAPSADNDVARKAEVDSVDSGTADDPHALGGASHSEDTLANLNSKVQDATLDDAGDSRPAEAHASSHVDGGADAISGALNIGALGAILDANDDVETAHLGTILDANDDVQTARLGSILDANNDVELDHLGTILDANDDVEPNHLGSILDANDDVEYDHLGNATHVPHSLTQPNLGLNTWRNPNANRPTLLCVTFELNPGSTTSAQIDLEVDESGGTTPDYRHPAAVPSSLSASQHRAPPSVVIPAGGSYQFNEVSTGDGVSVTTHTEHTL